MNNRLFAFLFFAVIASFVSCKDKDLTPPTPVKTSLNVVNASADTLKYYINGTRQNNISNIFSGGQTGYLSVISGAQLYKVSKATGSFATLYSTTLALDTAAFYSYFIAGETVDNSFLLVDPLADANTVVQSDTTFTTSVIRFVNASPNVSPLHVTVGVGDTVNFTGCKFGTATSYVPFKLGSKEVKIYTSDDAILRLDTTINFISGQVYTLFSSGMLNGTGTARFSVALTN